jgi:hypothetical protein
MGRNDEAIVALERALSLQPNLAQARDLLNEIRGVAVVP